MTLTETFDRFELIIGDAVIHDETEDDTRAEPSLTAAPFFIEFDEPARLDPERAGLIWELAPASIRTIWLRSPLVSLAVHLALLIAIVAWPLMVVEPAPLIPVQLVFEAPPPPAPPPPEPTPEPAEPKLQSGRLSSVDMGDIKQPLDLGASKVEKPPSAGETQPDASEAKAAQTPPPPVPMPKPAPPREKQSAFLLPKPSGAPVTQHDDTPRPAPRAARYPGPGATRDEYLAYLVTLTRQHIDLLPMSVVGARRGETIISVLVYEDGRIGPISVVSSSGYPDIDQRIEQMVGAVHKFPPLPQWYQSNAVQLELTLRFPEALR